MCEKLALVDAYLIQGCVGKHVCHMTTQYKCEGCVCGNSAAVGVPLE